MATHYIQQLSTITMHTSRKWWLFVVWIPFTHVTVSLTHSHIRSAEHDPSVWRLNSENLPGYSDEIKVRAKMMTALGCRARARDLLAEPKPILNSWLQFARRVHLRRIWFYLVATRFGDIFAWICVNTDINVSNGNVTKLPCPCHVAPSSLMSCMCECVFWLFFVFPSWRKVICYYHLQNNMLFETSYVWTVGPGVCRCRDIDDDNVNC